MSPTSQKLQAKLWWDTRKNIPLLEPREECIEKVFLSDVRPLFRPEMDRLRCLIEAEFGHSAVNRLLDFNVAIATQVKDYVDHMIQVFTKGEVFGYLMFDVREMRWVFRHGPLSAAKALVEGYASYGVLWSRRVKRARYSISDFKEFRKGVSSQVVLLGCDGRIVGVGMLREGYVSVFKKWRRGFDTDIVDLCCVPGSWDDVFKANEDALWRLVSRSIRTLYVASKKLSGRVPTLSFSGGKDSTATLLVSLDAGIEPKVIFNDTGAELPETLTTVEAVERRLKLDIARVHAEADIYRETLEKGPPARNYRWCTRVLKVLPTIKFFKSLNKPVLNIVGLRMYESESRARTPAVYRQYGDPDVMAVAPIIGWNGLATWLYILSKNAPYNPLYLVSFERIGCFMCPASTLAEFNYTRRIHEDLWRRWEAALLEYAKKMGESREWVEYGLWRWRGDAPKKRILCKLLGIGCQHVQFTS